MKPVVLCVFVLALLAAVASPMAGAQPASGKRVLVVNLIEPELTLSHLGFSAFTTSERKLENDWSIDAHAMDVVTRLLAGAGYEAVTVESKARPEKVLKHELATLSGKPTLTREFAAWLRGAMESVDTEQAIVLQTYGREWSPMTYAEYSGYGFNSTMGDPPKHVWIFANVRALVAPRATLKLAKGMSPRDSDCRVEIDARGIAGGSMKAWTVQAFKPHQEALRGLVERRLRQDLASAGLLAGPAERCRLVAL